MCGIVGFTGRERPELMASMMRAVRHRGPDEAGSTSAGGCVHLGQQRLIVLDPEGGRQPIWSRDGRFLLVYNGEIYNHGALREELAVAGIETRSHSDTELFVEALAAFGVSVLPRIDGMFAIAAFDCAERQMHLAIDRFGQKPLITATLSDRTVVFASELQALLLHPEVSGELDLLALCRMLAFNSPPAPDTIMADVRRLEPASLLTLKLDADGTVLSSRLSCWWHPDPDVPPDESDPGRFETALAASIRRQLVADVPVGVLLSGGLDSSVVASLAVRERSISTISLGFDDPAYDESTLSRKTAELLGTDHHEFRLEEAAIPSLLLEATKACDEPLADAGMLPAFFLYQQTRRLVTVALSGDGGDELLEGYPTYAAMNLARRLSQFAGLPLSQLLRMAARVWPASDSYYPFGYQLERFAEGLEAKPWHRFQAFMGGVTMSTFPRLVRREILDAAGLLGPNGVMADRLYAPARPGTLPIDSGTSDIHLHLRNYLAGEVLRKVDRMSMAHSLEVRAPILASDFADLCLNAAPTTRRRGRLGKLPFRRILSKGPLAHIANRKKQGFAIPVARWLRTILRDIASPFFLDSSSPLRAYCEKKPLARLFLAHQDKKEDRRKELWTLLSLGLWLEQNPPGSTPP